MQRCYPLVLLFSLLFLPQILIAQPRLVVEPDTLFYSNQAGAENVVLVQNEGADPLRIDSLRFSTFPPASDNGWGIRLILPDTTVDLLYAFGDLEDVSTFPDIRLSPQDSIQIKFGNFTECLICGGASSKGKTLAVRDSLFIYSNDTDNNPRSIPIDFALFVGTEDPEIASPFALETFPNPFSQATRIRYTLPTASHVLLTVYDMLGRKVTTLVNRQQAAGLQEAVFKADRLSSGPYVYRLQASGQTQTGKVLLQK